MNVAINTHLTPAATNNAAANSTVACNSATKQMNALTGELARIEAGSTQDLTATQAYLEIMARDAFRRVAKGELQAFDELLETLRPLDAFTERYLTDEPDARKGAARKVFEWLEVLRTAQEALEQPQEERELLNRADSSTRRALLRVLWSHRGDYHRRAELHKSLMKQGETRVNESRVSQLLAEFHQVGMVRKLVRPARGGQVPFYALTQRGIELCEREKLHVPAVQPERALPQRVVSINTSNEGVRTRLSDISYPQPANIVPPYSQMVMDPRWETIPVPSMDCTQACIGG